MGNRLQIESEIFKLRARSTVWPPTVLVRPGEFHSECSRILIFWLETRVG